MSAQKYADLTDEQKKKRIKSAREWALANPERKRAINRKYQDAHKEECFQRTRSWIKDNPERYAAWRKEWLANNKQKTRGYTHFYTYRMKQELLDHYGHLCNNCGIEDEDVLVIDHFNNDGAEHRREFKGKYSQYKSIKDAGYPDSYQVLCCNCNWKKHVNGGTL